MTASARCRNNSPVPPIRCPRCGGSWTGLAACHCSVCHQSFTGVSAFDRHRRDCPISLALDDVVAADHAWLAQHPAAPHRYRPAELVELAEPLAAGEDITSGRWRVRTRRHPYGLERLILQDRRPVLYALTETAAAR